MRLRSSELLLASLAALFDGAVLVLVVVVVGVVAAVGVGGGGGSGNAVDSWDDILVEGSPVLVPVASKTF